MAAAAWNSTATGRRTCAPEIYITKRIDNSRLVKVADPERKREMLLLTVAVVALFVLVIGYAWQHFSAIEYGYRIEALRAQRDSLGELNRALRLEEASLRDPERIDALAQQMGLVAPQAGQVIRMDSGDDRDAGGPVMARVSVVVPTVQY